MGATVSGDNLKRGGKKKKSNLGGNTRLITRIPIAIPICPSAKNNPFRETSRIGEEEEEELSREEGWSEHREERFSNANIDGYFYARS